MKRATTIDEQIAKLKQRGMQIDIGDKKADEVLSDIGYFRLGFYCFPFEKTYPQTWNRNHQYRKDAKLSNVIDLYYLDAELRNILSKYINRIEINFRTNIVYRVSNKYIDNNIWFVDPRVMQQEFIAKFDEKLYTDNFKKHNPVIKNHHIRYPNNNYAPAWKTLEYFTFGSMQMIYKKLQDESLKKEIAHQYNIRNIEVMERYIDSIIEIRNICAHGGVLFDHKLSRPLRNGPALSITNENKNKLNSVVQVILCILRSISENRDEDMKSEIEFVFQKFKSDIAIRCIIENSIGYKNY